MVKKQQIYVTHSNFLGMRSSDVLSICFAPPPPAWLSVYLWEIPRQNMRKMHICGLNNDYNKDRVI
jgi:hypothetical protein